MKFRKLRIAWSVTCGIIAVLLCVLWVRSYWQWDILSYDRSSVFIAINSLRGVVQVNVAENPSPEVGTGWHRKVEHLTGRFPRFATTYGFAGESSATSISLTFPRWLLLLASWSLALVPSLSFRFTLRALLIATTLIAAVLGAVVYAVR